MAISKRVGKRGTTYRVIVYVRGKQRWQTFKTLNEARSFEAEARLGKVGQSTRLTFGQYLDQWHESVIKPSDREPATIANHARAIRRTKSIIGDLPLKRLGPADLQRLIAIWRETLSQGSVFLYLQTIEMALKRAVQWHMIPENPLDTVEKPSEPEPKVRAWDEEQLSLFLGAAKRQSRYYGLYYLAAHTGMRLGECLGLRWEDIDFTKPAIYLKQQSSGGRVKTRLKTRLSASIVSLAGQDSLIAYLMNLARPFELVFPQPDGRPILGQRISEDMETLCKIAGLAHLTFKDLRHTHATLLAKLEVPVKVIQERLRHSTPMTTLKFYTAALPGMQDDAARKIGEVLR